METVKAGTMVKLPDGRIGTVVYNGLDGVGIKWGEHDVDEKALACGFDQGEDAAPDGYKYFPDAMLREPYGGTELECVGEEYDVIRAPKENRAVGTSK